MMSQWALEALGDRQWESLESGSISGLGLLKLANETNCYYKHLGSCGLGYHLREPQRHVPADLSSSGSSN